MKPVTSSITISWSIHDSWAETLAGSNYLLSQLNESDQIKDKAHLCRLVLISANHLIEKLFFDLVQESLDSSSDIHKNIRREMDNVSLHLAMREWPQILVPKSGAFDFNSELYHSADALRKQRNRSIHKQSELVSLEMAKKSLYTAIETCKLIWNHFHPDEPFKYEGFLAKYPVEKAGYYSTSRNINIHA